MRKTKIICTMGPAVDDEQILRQVILNWRCTKCSTNML